MKFQIEVLKSKIHRVSVTQADLNYVGSITIDEELMDAANMIEGEKYRYWTSITANASKPILSKESGAAVRSV